eukprot:11363509-Alexandrium_andersonii.AAC.1
MSASLVGSEMCIRDRPSSSAPAGGTNTMSPSRSSNSVWKKALDTSSVSYTHLTLPTICSV